MNKHDAWVAAASAEGSTASERILTRLAKKAFLSMWSYANVYTDEGRKGGKGAGKEFCDLLVVFGDHVLLFSDKHCAFNEVIDVKVAWRRWYSAAIEKSCRQLEGAEKFVKSHPGRLFLDKMCEAPFPVPLPPPERAIFHLIAVTRGGHAAAAKHYGGGSSGTLVLLTALIGDMHHDTPFHVGYPLKSRRFVHVLDEMSVDVLLDELDTVADLVAYLGAKEKCLDTAAVVSIPGEEDLLARYMLNEDAGKRRFDLAPAGDGELLMLQEGDWFNYRNSCEQIGRRFANKESYLWDELIERHAGHVQRGVAVTGDEMFGDGETGSDHELVLRAMASESRLARRQLVEHLKGLINRPSDPGQVHCRMVSINGTRAYIFLTAAKTEDQSYEDYRRFRAGIARVYAFGYRSRLHQLQEMVCIVSEPLNDGSGTRDLLYVQFTAPMPADEVAEIDEQVKQLGILRPETKLILDRNKVSDFPMPFKLERPPTTEFGIGNSSEGEARKPERGRSKAKPKAKHKRRR